MILVVIRALAQYLAAVITLVILVVVGTLTQHLAAVITLVILVVIGAFTQRLAAVVTLVILVVIRAFAQRLAAVIALVILVGVGAHAQHLTTVVALVILVGVGAFTQHLAAVVTLVILVVIRAHAQHLAAGIADVVLVGVGVLRIGIFRITAVGALVPVMRLVGVPLLFPAVAGGVDLLRLFPAAFVTGKCFFARICTGRLCRYLAIVPIMGAPVSFCTTAGILFPVVVFVTLPLTQCSGVVVGVRFAILGVADIAFWLGNAGGFAAGAVFRLGVAGVAGADAGVGDIAVGLPCAPVVAQNAAGFKGSLAGRTLGAQAANRAGLVVDRFLRAAGAGFQVLLLCRLRCEVVRLQRTVLALANLADCLGSAGGFAAGTIFGFGGIAVLTPACPRVRTAAIGRPTPQMAQRRARLLIQMVVVIFDQIAGAHPVVQRVMRTVCG